MVISTRNIDNIITLNDHFEENGELLICKALINDGSIVFDIGARDTIIPDVNDKATYHLFEPINYNFVRLVDKFSDKLNVYLIRMAASDKIEETYIFKESESISKRNNFNYIWHQVNPDRVKDGMTEKIDTIKLYNYVIQNNIQTIDLLKIDVEGYEYNVLNGLENKLDIVKNIMFEYSKETYGDSGNNLQAVFDLLKDNFDIFVVQSDGIVAFDIQNDFNKVVTASNLNFFATKKNG